MLDRSYVLENAEAVAETCRKRYREVDVQAFVAAEQERRRLIGELDSLRAEINAVSGDKSLDIETKRERGRTLRAREKELRQAADESEARADALLMEIPNLMHPSVPVGETDTESRELFRGVTAPPSFDVAPKDHVELAAGLDILDMESASKIAGPGFYYLKGDGFLLDLALQRYALDKLIAAGYVPHTVPELVRGRYMTGAGFQPRGAETNVYAIEDEDLSLIATSEIPLCALHADQILDEAALPLRLCGVSHCFRTERAHGAATRGLYRVHQFTKVEMVVYCTPEESERFHDELLRLETSVFDGLEIPYRVVDIASGDLGAPAYRKYDIEAWMPGRGEAGEYGEVTSASNCTDYQARRLGIRYRPEGSKQKRFVHLLNGTGIAVGRAMIALLENHQNADGTVTVPPALRPYLGKDVLGAA